MSKAFTSESDDRDEILNLPPLPSGIKNYMTPAGAERLEIEIKKLQQEKENMSASDVATQSRRDKIENRLRFLIPRFEAVRIIDPLQQARDRVLFGARVTLRDAQGQKETWRIVGIDELNLDQGDISWTSPLATALLDKKQGDTFTFLNRILTIERIDYQS